MKLCDSALTTIGSSLGVLNSFLQQGHLYGFVAFSVLKQVLHNACLHDKILLFSVSHRQIGQRIALGRCKSCSEL